MKKIRFQAIDMAIRKNGIKIALLLRVSPIVPFTTLNYVLGVSSISSKDNLISLLGFIPDALVYSYLGSTIQNIQQIKKKDPTD